MTHIKSKINPDFTWNIKNNAPMLDTERAFIETFNPSVYHNDIECYLWAFDEKLPSGAWLENIRFSGDLRTATAHIYRHKGGTA